MHQAPNGISSALLMHHQLVSAVHCLHCRLAGSGALARMPTGNARTAASGSLHPGGTTVQRPAAPDLVANATSAAVSAAASAVDLSCMEIDVVAVGMGLRFVEIETGSQVGFHPDAVPHTAHCHCGLSLGCFQHTITKSDFMYMLAILYG